MAFEIPSTLLPSAARPNMVLSYFEGLEPDEMITAFKIAEEIAGTKPLADTVVIIPVAAHQDHKWIASTIDQYARQKTDEPFSLVLGLNCPIDYQFFPEARLSQFAVRDAKQRHPNLDIRSIFKPYEEPVVIGQVRRDLWNGVMYAALKNGQISEERTVIGLNQDIDLMSMWPTSLRAIQRVRRDKIEEHNLLPVLGMAMVHGPSPDHPNITKAVAWHDHIHVQLKNTYEAGLIIPAEMYVLAGGIDGESSLSEVFSSIGRPSEIIAGAYATTSPRRYHQRIHNDGLKVWKRGSFSAIEDYRVTDDYPDISSDYAHNLISEALYNDAYRIGRTAFNSVVDELRNLKRLQPEMFDVLMEDNEAIEQMYEARITRKQIVGSRVLNKLTGSTALGEKYIGFLPTNVSEVAENIYNTVILPADVKLYYST